VATAETRHPEDAGTLKERALLIRVAQWLTHAVAHHKRLETIEYRSIYTAHIVSACSSHFYNAYMSTFSDEYLVSLAKYFASMPGGRRTPTHLPGAVAGSCPECNEECA
jgi:hypothetical protein